MSPEQLLNELARRGVELWIDAGTLRFKAPKDALDAATMDALKAQKQAIIDHIAARGGSYRCHPLSYGQRSLWFLHQVAPETAAYNVAYPCRIRSSVDRDAFERALGHLAARHSALRTAVVARNGEPFLEVSDNVDVTCEVVDVIGCSQSELVERIETEYRRPFDLTRAPLLRATLFQQAPEDQVLLLVLHHLVCDGWSLMQTIVDELGKFYEAEIDGCQCALSSSVAQYVDYVHWQRQYLTLPTAKKSRDYWVDKLSGELPVLDLPTDFPRPAVSALRGDSFGIELPKAVADAIRVVAQAHNATLYMYLVAAFQVLLFRNTNQEEILIGSPTSGRNHPDFATMVGHLVNTVVLRSNLGANPSFAELLRHVRSEVLHALDHQDYPFTLLVEHLQPNRDLSRSPIFQAMVVTHKSEGREELFGGNSDEGESLRWGGMVIEPFAMSQQAGQFDLTLEVAEVGDSLVCVFKYNAEIFSRERITTLAGYFQRLVESINLNPDQGVADLPMLSDHERRLQLETWNETVADWSRDSCVHELFEARARSAPDAVAVLAGAATLTYRELDERANRLAEQLRYLGVGPEKLVAVFLPREPSLIVSLLAIMKAGGAYVPLDPRYPAQRIEFMLEDADACVVVTTSALADALPNSRATVFCIDAPMADIPPTEKSAVACTPQNLAYVLFTSGSTGRPKGVQIEHHSAAAMLCWARDAFSTRERAYVLASTSVCFDLSVFEIFTPLSWGGAVVLAENALELPSLPSAERITLINTVPSAIAELVRINGIPESVITVNLAGEPLKGQLVQDIYRNTQTERVLNLYGPSEDTTYSTWACIPRGSEAAPTIGRPISNTKVFVLSPHMQPVPIGAIGELYIGGEGLSRGYLKRPELTAERFVRNPFSENPDTRMYKTGDFVRYLPDGELQYLGRIDNQVKLRGFRIELGEVEEILSRFPGVQEVAALIKHDRHQTAKLVAYLAPKPGVTELLPTDLREYAKGQLPHFMVPTEFFVLDHMPHSPNGKIDRAALPEPVCDHSVAEETQSASAVEQLVRSVWSEILGRSSIGLDEHFFEVGGHSLLAAKVIYRLNEILDMELNVGAMFEFPTVAALAGAIQAAKSGASHIPGNSESRVDLVAEAVLSPDIFPSDAAGGATALVNAKAVLLSGATGYVGSYLLMELLSTTNAVIHCLVRANDSNTAMQRIDAAVGRHGFRNIENLRSRIRPVLGNLDAPRFGLSEEAFVNLATEVDLLFHSAATINLAYPYHLLKPTNVDGTTEFIRLACTGTVKPLHYVSTISVFDAANYFDGRVIREDDEPDEIQGLDHGYAQTKWVAERRVKAASERGLPVTIYRLGSVIGASDTGIWQADDIMHRMLSAAMELEQWLNVDLVTYLVPVDYVAKSIVELSRQESSMGQTFHLVASNVVRSEDIREWLSGSGVNLAPVSAAEWKANFVKQLTGVENTHWASLLLLIEAAFSNEQLEKLVERHARSPRFDCSATERALHEAAIAIPKIDEQMMQRFLGTNGNFGLSRAAEAVAAVD